MASTSHLSVTEEDEEFRKVNDDGFDHLLHRLSVCNSSFTGDGEDSDKDQRCYSLPATPPWRHRRRGAPEKDYVSENEARKGSRKRVPNGKSSRRSGAAAEAAVVVITRPKGGRRSLCMDLEEVKACHELGFELEHQEMLEVVPRPPPYAAAASGQNVDYQSSSGGSSPIASWRISSPGDDPKEVKARLKVWAQAVALVSASTKY